MRKQKTACPGCSRTEAITRNGRVLPIKLVRELCQACREVEAECKSDDAEKIRRGNALALAIASGLNTGR